MSMLLGPQNLWQSSCLNGLASVDYFHLRTQRLDITLVALEIGMGSNTFNQRRTAIPSDCFFYQRPMINNVLLCERVEITLNGYFDCVISYRINKDMFVINEYRIAEPFRKISWKLQLNVL